MAQIASVRTARVPDGRCASRRSPGADASARTLREPRDVEQDPDLEHRDAEMRRDQLLLRVPSRPSGRRAPPGTRTSPKRRDAGAHQRAVLAVAAPREHASAAISSVTAAARMRCEYSMIMFVSISGTTRPPHSGQPSVPLPSGPQPSPESLIRTTPPTMTSRKVSADRHVGEPAKAGVEASRASMRRDSATGSGTALGGCGRRRAPPARARGAGCPSSARRCGRSGSRRSCASGGGEVVNHSSVFACHGSGPARPALAHGPDDVHDRHEHARARG